VDCRHAGNLQIIVPASCALAYLKSAPGAGDMLNWEIVSAWWGGEIFLLQSVE
jgi:hypothetical protein